MATSRNKSVARGLREHACLDAVTVQRKVVLRKIERMSFRDANLQLHQVEGLTFDADDLLRDRVLHLQPCVHFHEEHLLRLGIVDELDGACADVADGLGRRHGYVANAAALLHGEVRGGGLFEHFLVPALHGAVAFEEVDAVVVFVAEHLNFNMSRSLNESLEEHTIVLEEIGRLSAGRLKQGEELVGGPNDFHSFSTATADRFDQEGKPHSLRLGSQRGVRLVLTMVAGYHRDARSRHDNFALAFRPHGDNR